MQYRVGMAVVEIGAGMGRFPLVGVATVYITGQMANTITTVFRFNAMVMNGVIHHHGYIQVRMNELSLGDTHRRRRKHITSTHTAATHATGIATAHTTAIGKAPDGDVTAIIHSHVAIHVDTAVVNYIRVVIQWGCFCSSDRVEVTSPSHHTAVTTTTASPSSGSSESLQEIVAPSRRKTAARAASRVLKKSVLIC